MSAKLGKPQVSLRVDANSGLRLPRRSFEQTIQKNWLLSAQGSMAYMGSAASHSTNKPAALGGLYQEPCYAKGLLIRTRQNWASTLFTCHPRGKKKETKNQEPPWWRCHTLAIKKKKGAECSENRWRGNGQHLQLLGALVKAETAAVTFSGPQVVFDIRDVSSVGQ